MFNPKSVLMYFVYLLQSEMDGSFYVGYSTDITRRLQEHNEGESRYTSKKRPWKLAYVESFNSKREALIRERFLKSQRNRVFYEKLKESGSVG